MTVLGACLVIDTIYAPRSSCSHPSLSLQVSFLGSRCVPDTPYFYSNLVTCFLHQCLQQCKATLRAGKALLSDSSLTTAPSSTISMGRIDRKNFQKTLQQHQTDLPLVPSLPDTGDSPSFLSSKSLSRAHD